MLAEDDNKGVGDAAYHALLHLAVAPEASKHGPLESGHFIEKDDDSFLVRDESKYQKRFSPFAEFYQTLRSEQYPLAYAEQGIVYHLPEQGMLILGLNSAWEINHHYRDRASIHPDALGRALTAIRQAPAYDACPLKIAVWHHPMASASEDRIKDARIPGATGQGRLVGIRGDASDEAVAFLHIVCQRPSASVYF